MSDQDPVRTPPAIKFFVSLVMTALLTIFWFGLIFPIWISRFLASILWTIYHAAVGAWRGEDYSQYFRANDYIGGLFFALTARVYGAIWHGPGDGLAVPTGMGFWREAAVYGFTLFGTALLIANQDFFGRLWEGISSRNPLAPDGWAAFVTAYSLVSSLLIAGWLASSKKKDHDLFKTLSVLVIFSGGAAFLISTLGWLS